MDGVISDAIRRTGLRNFVLRVGGREDIALRVND